MLLASDLNEPRANPKASAVGTVIDSDTQSGRGATATVLVQNGTLRVGDIVVAGAVYGRVRSLTDEHGKRVKEAGPSKPVVITGLNDVPLAGEMFQVLGNERPPGLWPRSGRSGSAASAPSRCAASPSPTWP